MKKNGVFLFVISHLVPEIFKIFVLCKLCTDDVIRCGNMEVKTQNREFHRHFNLNFIGTLILSIYLTKTKTKTETRKLCKHFCVTRCFLLKYENPYLSNFAGFD